MARNPKPTNAPEAGGKAFITLEVAAKLLMLSPRRIQQLVADGWISQPERGKYTVVGVVHGYIKFRDDVDRSAQQKSAMTRLGDKRAEEIDLRIARDTKALQNEARVEALDVADELIGGIRTDLIAMPARLTADLALRRKLETLIDDVLRSAAKRAADAANGPSEGGDASDAGAEDDA